MKYIKLNFPEIASSVRRQINDDEVQKIVLAEDYLMVELVIDKTLVRSFGSNCWKCKVVSANIYTTDGELIASKLFGFDDLDEMIGLVGTEKDPCEVIACTQCGSIGITKAHSTGAGQVFICKQCSNAFIVKL